MGETTRVRLGVVSSVRLTDFIKAYDVRGIVPDQLDERVVRAIGIAFAEVVAQPDGARSVVVGHDMRPSSPALARAFAEGVASCGPDVTMIGLCSTDQLYYASGALDCPGAMFTASHNPAQYNGIKMCRSAARPVGQDTGLADITVRAQALLDGPADDMSSGPTGQSDGAGAALSAPVHDAGEPVQAGSITSRDMLADYGEFLRELVDLRRIRPLKVVVDAGNGMGGLTVPAVLAGLPLDIVPMYFELDGTFPNHEANPLEPENLRDLQAAVLAHSADIGLAFDGDADRCFVIDERGEPVSPSAITALVAEREIAKEVARGHRAADVTIVYNAISSHAVPETVAQHGATGVRTRVGHSFIKAQMAQHNAVFGGEHSAHYYFRDFWYADTGMLAAMYVLAALGGQDGPLSALVSGYDRYPTSGELNSKVASVEEATARVEAWASRLPVQTDHLDGLTVDHQGQPSWWFNLRPSNTEPLLRLNVEASDSGTMARIRDEVLGLVRGDGS